MVNFRLTPRYFASTIRKAAFFAITPINDFTLKLSECSLWVFGSKVSNKVEHMLDIVLVA